MNLDNSFDKAIRAIEQDSPGVLGHIDEYLTAFLGKLEEFRIIEFDGPIDDSILETLDAFLPIRNQYVELIVKTARFSPDVRWATVFHRFIEELIHYTNPRRGQKRVEYDMDNFKFILHEVFLYTIATLLKFERFEQAAYLLSQRYYVPQGSDHGFMASFDDIHKHMGSLEERNERLEIGSEAIRADILRERCSGTEVTINDLMQADFTIFLRAELENYPKYSQWWPELLTFLTEEGGAFGIYVRAHSKSYFDRLKVVLGIVQAQDLQPLIDAYKAEARSAPRGMKPRTIAKLVGYEFLTITTTP